MSKKDNFNEAVYSMFGVGKAPVEAEKEEVSAEVEIPEVKKEEVEVAEVVVEERLPLTRIAEGTALEGKLVAQGSAAELCAMTGKARFEDAFVALAAPEEVQG